MKAKEPLDARPKSEAVGDPADVLRKCERCRADLGAATEKARISDDSALVEISPEVLRQVDAAGDLPVRGGERYAERRPSLSDVCGCRGLFNSVEDGDVK